MTLSPAKKTNSQGGKKINTREKKEDGHWAPLEKNTHKRKKTQEEGKALSLKGNYEDKQNLSHSNKTSLTRSAPAGRAAKVVLKAS